MDEIWGVIPDFENYSVSNYGAVRNERGHLLTGHVNQSGLVYVSLHRYGREYNRSLAPIVARVFVGPPAHISWNTVIHLNGNRKDMFYENLMWRPRWFANSYHDRIRIFHALHDIREVVTGEEGTVVTLSKKYGLIPNEVFRQAFNYTKAGNDWDRVWPTGQIFELI